MPVPSVARPSAPSTSADTAQRAVALAEGDVVQRGAAEPAPGREKRDRLEQIGLAGAVRADQHDRAVARLKPAA